MLGLSEAAKFRKLKIGITVLVIGAFMLASLPAWADYNYRAGDRLLDAIQPKVSDIAKDFAMDVGVTLATYGAGKVMQRATKAAGLVNLSKRIGKRLKNFTDAFRKIHIMRKVGQNVAKVMILKGNDPTTAKYCGAAAAFLAGGIIDPTSIGERLGIGSLSDTTITIGDRLLGGVLTMGEGLTIQATQDGIYKFLERNVGDHLGDHTKENIAEFTGGIVGGVAYGALAGGISANVQFGADPKKRGDLFKSIVGRYAPGWAEIGQEALAITASEAFYRNRPNWGDMNNPYIADMAGRIVAGSVFSLASKWNHVIENTAADGKTTYYTPAPLKGNFGKILKNVGKRLIGAGAEYGLGLAKRHYVSKYAAKQTNPAEYTRAVNMGLYVVSLGAKTLWDYFRYHDSKKKTKLLEDAKDWENLANNPDEAKHQFRLKGDTGPTYAQMEAKYRRKLEGGYDKVVQQQKPELQKKIADLDEELMDKIGDPTASLEEIEALAVELAFLRNDLDIIETKAGLDSLLEHWDDKVTFDLRAPAEDIRAKTGEVEGLNSFLYALGDSSSRDLGHAMSEYADIYRYYSFERNPKTGEIQWDPKTGDPKGNPGYQSVRQAQAFLSNTGLSSLTQDAEDIKQYLKDEYLKTIAKKPSETEELLKRFNERFHDRIIGLEEKEEKDSYPGWRGFFMPEEIPRDSTSGWRMSLVRSLDKRYAPANIHTGILSHRAKAYIASTVTDVGYNLYKAYQAQQEHERHLNNLMFPNGDPNNFMDPPPSAGPQASNPSAGSNLNVSGSGGINNDFASLNSHADEVDEADTRIKQETVDKARGMLWEIYNTVIAGREIEKYTNEIREHELAENEMDIEAQFPALDPFGGSYVY